MNAESINKIKEIVATFLKVSPENIHAGTAMDHSAIAGSIWIHRMYAVLSRELNIKILNYEKIKTVGDLMERIGSEGYKEELSFFSAPESVVSSNDVRPSDFPARPEQPQNGFVSAVGIDMEDIENMPMVKDFKSDEFYLQNFSSKEIEYCLSKENPLTAFTGLFAVKEAVVKADNSYQCRAFNSIEITHDQSGRPVFGHFLLSISHTDKQAVAVAVKVGF